MAKNSEKVRGSNRHWTNERHVNFLNSMEASFVHSMLQNNGRLDRYLPDTSDSTHDLGIDTPRRNSHLPESGGRRTEKKKTRNIACQKSSQDQVVPQIGNERDDGDKDDRDHHLNVSRGAAH